MYWRQPSPKAFEGAKGAGNRAAFEALVTSGRATGILAFEGDAAVGWCSVGPRADFPRVVNHRSLGREAPAGTWSVNCFYIPARRRGQGVASVLLDAAVTFASEQGATEIEAYPVTPNAGKVPAAFAWTGVDAMFEKAGFRRLEREGRAIWVR